MDYTRTMRLTGRKYFSVFELINTISFTFLAGNILTLLLLRLGAGDVVIGILNSFIYLSFFFMPLGRRRVYLRGAVRNFASSWIIRYSMMLPVVAVPFFFSENRTAGIALVFIGYFGFQIFRGIGIVSINPILKEISAGKDQGRFLSRLQILVHGGGIFANSAVALFVGSNAPVWRYGIPIAIGSVLGVFGALAFRRIPEPVGYLNPSDPAVKMSGPYTEGGDDAALPDTTPQDAATTAGRSSGETLHRKPLRTAFGDSLRIPRVRTFFVSFFLMIFFSSMYRPFLTVYAKQQYAMTDAGVLVLGLITSLGAVFMGIINRWMLDRAGAKPMIMIFTGIIAVSAVLLLFAPLLSGFLPIVLLGAVFFLSLMGASGSETSSQGYFFALMPAHDQLELGILYYLVMGAAGSLGSVLGGVVLELFKGIRGVSLEAAFVLFFAVALAGLLSALASMFRIERLRGKSLSEALSVLFSLRDWRAMSLIRKLEVSKTVDQEQDVLRKLQGLGSDISISEVLDRLKSPLFRIRREALNTVAFLPYTEEIEETLIQLVEENSFGTCYPAARILGNRGSEIAVPVLRAALAGTDALLAANAASALAELGDRASKPVIEELMERSQDRNILVYGAMALRVFGDISSIPVLYRTAERNHDAPVVVQETAFAIAGILKVDERIHRDYPLYLENKTKGLRSLVENTTGSHADAIVGEIESRSPQELVELVLERNPAGLHWAEARHILIHPGLFRLPAYSFLFHALITQGYLDGTNADGKNDKPG